MLKLLFGILLTDLLIFAVTQEPVFDIPVQLVGFPVITISVRLANFAKKLMYSLNPGTYKSITKRSCTVDTLKTEEFKQILEVQNIIQKEFGSKSCILEDICKYHSENPKLDELTYIEYAKRIYKEKNRREKTWLISAFVGKILKEPKLCSDLQKILPCE